MADLLEETGIPIHWTRPGPALESDVLDVHDSSYVDTVKAASKDHLHSAWARYGLGTADVPVFHDMHDATCAVCGGSLAAGRRLLEGANFPILQLGGGLHHAMPARAAGFCVYNDVAMLIRLLRRNGMRVAYVDIDVHHADGVQAIFYRDPNVLTVSMHQSGQYLYPGTGSVDELGSGEAVGTAVNVPLHPGTGDASYLECFDAVVPPTLTRFSPDVLVVEVGADAHYLDPLANLNLTTFAYRDLFDRLVGLSKDLSGGRMVVTLGGGYNFDSTIRIWTILAYRLADLPPPEQLPPSWVYRWESRLKGSAGPSLHDQESTGQLQDLRSVAAEVNARTVESLIDTLNQLA